MKKMPKSLLAFSVLALVYLILGITLPPNTPTIETYHLSMAEYRVLVLMVCIPLIAVWFATFYGYARLEEYVELIHSTDEGRSLNNITKGLRVLAWGLPIITIITTILGAIVHAHEDFVNAAFVIVHYLPLAVALLAFAYISSGSRQLTEISDIRPSHLATRWVFGVFTVLGVLFTYASIHTALEHSNPYHLPMWFILLTIVAPYLYAWFMGFYAAYEIVMFSQRSKGLLYRQALRNVATGIVITIVTSVIFQYTQSDTTRLRRISFSWVFFGLYLLLLLYASGFLLIGRGAKQLKKIEEV